MPNYRTNAMPYGACYSRNPASVPAMDRCTVQVPETTPSCKDDMVLAMAYVPWQEWKNLYSAEKAFCKGTIFEDLDKPFSGKGGCCK